MRRLVLAVSLFVAAPAVAQTAAMSGAQLKTALFGIEMSGYSPSYEFSWRECIQPDGKTLYETPDGVVNGKLTISAKGEACFSYEDDGYRTQACYLTRKTDKGFRFEGDFDSLFIATKVVTGITSCKPQDLIG
jgi:hypothetical protein